MSLWKILTRVWDPLGELPTPDERTLRRQYEAARHKAQVLENALRGGSDVEQPFKKAKQEVSDLLQRLPHGHTLGFMALCLWFAGTLTPLVLAYMGWQFFFVEMWQSPENWYLQEYRPFSAYLWQWWQILVSSPWSVFIPILVLAFVWATQRRLLRWQARAFIRVVAAVEALFIVLSASAFLELVRLPLG